GAIANLVIELILVPGMGYGVGASALSTVVTQVAVGAASTVLVVRWARSNGAGLAPDWAEMSMLLRAGRALVIRTVSLRGSFTLSTVVAANIGVADVAAHQIALNVWGTLALALDAVAIAGQALTGKWLGVGDTATARGAARRMIEVDIGLGVLAGVVTFALRAPMAEVFTNDPIVVAAAGLALTHVALQQPIAGLVFALDGILIGAGDLDYLARWMVAAAAAFAACAATVWITGLGLGWLWAAIAVLIVVRAYGLVRRWREDTWLVTGV
ncbi:MAG: MATE family efflux transporter, partial [Acidimicrobiales bacterium]